MLPVMDVGDPMRTTSGLVDRASAQFGAQQSDRGFLRITRRGWLRRPLRVVPRLVSRVVSGRRPSVLPRRRTRSRGVAGNGASLRLLTTGDLGYHVDHP